MSKNIKLLLAAAIIAVGLFSNQLKDIDWDIKWPTDNDNSVVVVDEPSLEFQDMVKPIMEFGISPEDAAQIAPYFAEAASVVENDPGFLKTTGQFRDFNVMAGQLHFSGIDVDTTSYPGLGDAVDAAIIAAIGKENEAMDDEKRADLVAILEAISWSVNQ